MAHIGFLLFVFCAAFASLANAQAATGRPASRQFQWKWKNDGIGFSVATCQQLAIEVKSWDPAVNDTHGIPPYYMMSFPVGGTPVTKYIGDKDTELSWEVTHAVGSKLVLTVVDSTGSFGGVPPRMFDVIAGVSTSCVVPEPSKPEFTISGNVTGNLATCDPWGITIKGGVPPYNLSIAAVNSPVVTNVTIPSGFDAFTYINRAEPNGQMIVGVADYTGRWATGVPMVNTVGSEDYECPGLVSANGIASQLEEEARARKAASNKKRTAIIAGVTVPLVILLLAAIGFGLWWYRRRKAQGANVESTPKEVEPYAYQAEPLHLPQGMYNSSTGFSGHSKAALSLQESGMASVGGTLSYTSNGGHQSPSLYGSMNATSTSAYTSQESPPDSRHVGPAAFSSFSPNRKAAEAAQSSTISPDSEYASGSRQVGPGGEEIVIQHRDGGVVRELPPPYADRSLA